MPISFNAVGTFSGTVGGPNVLSNPTSLQFGPDGRLYVSEQNGSINAFTVSIQNGQYVATDHEELLLPGGGGVVKSLQNHNDDGSLSGSSNRQVTGIVTAGTAAEPVLYVSSSDPRIATNNDSGLDTNSGVVTKVSWNSATSQWEQVDLIRGLPRSEENHSVNGMVLSPDGSKLYLAVGGHTNNGAPSKFFTYTGEYALSGTVLEIDLNALDTLPIQIDPAGGQSGAPRNYKYNLPTLDDPNIPNITDGVGEDANGMDEAGPWGGNDGLNMAILPADAPLRIFAHGLRNNYDLAITEDGRLYTVDNGSNGNLGGNPNTEAGDLDGDGVSGEAINTPNNGGSGDPEPLFWIEEGGYYGHPSPIRANQNQSWTVYNNDGNPDGNVPTNTVPDISALVPQGVQIAPGFVIDPSKFAAGAGQSLSDLTPQELSDRLLESGIRIERDSAASNAIITTGSSTNGIVVYDSNGEAFDGYLDGKLFVTQFNDNVTLLNLNSTGDGLDPVPTEGADGIFGTADDGVQDSDGIYFVANNSLGVPLGNPLDVTVGPNGTLWVAEIGGNEITVLAPSDVILPGDNDSDDDGILNTDDPFLRDASNGTSVTINPGQPTVWEFSQDAGDVTPGPDGFGGGLTGVMINGTTDFEQFLQSPSDRPGQNIQLDNVKFVTAASGGTTTIEEVSNGDPYQTPNNGEFLFHTGFQLAGNVDTFTVQWVVANPGAINGGSDITNNFQQIGGYIGDGTQSNYLKIVAIATNNTASQANIQVALEDGDTILQTINLPANAIFNNGSLVPDSNIIFELEIDPGSATAIPKATFSTTNGEVTITGGANDVIDLTGSAVLDTILGNNTVQGQAIGVATGLFASNFGSNSDTFQAVFDSISVTATEAQVAPNAVDDAETTSVNGSLNISVDQLLANDSDANPADVLTVTGVSNAQGGSVALSNGVVTFTPDTDFQGDASFDYTITDGTNTATATVTVTVADRIVLYRVNAGGSQLAAIDGGLPWTADTSANNSPFLTNPGSNNTNGFAVQPGGTVADTTPAAIFTTERWDNPSQPPMQWGFDVDNGQYDVRLFMGNGFNGTSQPGARVFDVAIEGTVPANLDDLDLSQQFGHQIGAMLSNTVTVTDGTLNIEFLHGVENPLINGIEIIQVGNNVPQPTPEVNILSNAQLVSEDDGQVFISIATNFTVPLDETVDVNFTIEPISADTSAGPNGDYEYTSASAIFAGSTYVDTKSIAGGSSDLQIPINILPDDLTEGAEAFKLTINSVSPNATLGANSEAIVTIEANDAVTNPGDVVVRINAGGPDVAATDGGPAWSADQAQVANGSAASGPPSPFLVDRGIDGSNTNNSDNVSYGDNTPTGPGVNDTGAPDVLFTTERFGTQANPDNIGYAVPLPDGDYTVNLYFDELFFSAAGARIFDVEIEDTLVLDDFDTFATYGNDTGVQSFTTTVSDGVLNIEFLKGAANNPHIAAIEIIAADGSVYTPPLDDLFGTAVEISGDRLTPSDAGTLALGDNTMSATQEGEDGDNSVRDRDIFTFTVPDGFILTGIELDNLVNSNPVLTQGFLGIQLGNQLTVDVATGVPDLGTDGLLGGIIYNSGNVGQDLLDLMASGGEIQPGSGLSLDPFDPALTGDVTVWLNQGAGPSTASLNFIVEELPPPPIGGIVAAINAGGPALTQDGIEFSADEFFINGQLFTDNNAGNGQQPDFDGTIFETERYGGAPSSTLPFGYSIPVDPGDYFVDLFFAEIFQSNPGNRIFDVFVEGELVLDNFDILAETGDINQPAIVVTPRAFSPDEFGAVDAIDISFSASTDNAKVSGIVVREAEAGINTLPEVAPIADLTIDEGQTASVAITATDAELDPIALSAEVTNTSTNTVVDPTEYSFIDNGNGTGSFSWLTDEPDDGVYSVAVTAADADGQTTETFTLTVNEVIDPPTGEILFRVNAGGAEVAALDGGPAWSADTQANNSPFLTNPGSNSDFPTNGQPTGPIDTSLLTGLNVPEAVLGVERWDNPANPAMQWAFPVAAGTEVELRLYLAELFTGLPDLNGSGDPTGDRIFDVSVDGTIPAVFDNLDPYTLAGNAFNTGAVVTHTFISDGSIDLEFLHQSENPAIKGIEIVALSNPPAIPDVNLSVSTPTASETDATEITVTVTASEAVIGDQTVDLTLDGLGLTSNDFTGTIPTSLTILDGQTESSFTLAVNDDDVVEALETATFSISNPSLGLTLGSETSGNVEITDNDAIGAATVAVTLNNNNVQASNFGSNAFQITNIGDKDIAQITIDVTNALYPDSVFDPFGLAGDTLGKLLDINTNSSTGIIAPDHGTAAAPGSTYIGAGGTAGFEAIQLLFDSAVAGGFNPGETLGFSVDMDPNSIAGAQKSILDSGADPSWDIGGISGAELIGSEITITFTDGTQATGQLQGADNQAGSQAIATQDSPNLPVTLTVNGLGAGGVGSYDQTGPSVIVNGPAGETARIVLTKGFIQPVTNNFFNGNATQQAYAPQLQAQLDALAASDFPANNAVEFQTVDIVLDGTDQDISNLFDFSGVPIYDFDGEDQLPLGFVASIINGQGLPLGAVTQPIYLQFEGNEAPAIAPITDLTILEGEAATVNITATDAEDNAIALAIEVTNTSTSTIVDPADYSFIDNGNGTGTFSWLTDEPDDGIYSIAVTASDATGQTTETFALTVNEPLPTLSITVDEPLIAEGESGTFTINRLGSTDGNLQVSLVLAADAELTPADFTITGANLIALNNTSATVVIPDGVAIADLTFEALTDTAIEALESLTITIADAPDYLVDPVNASAAIAIDADPISLDYAIVANTSTITEGDSGSQTISFTITRSAATDDPFGVNFQTVDNPDFADAESDQDYVISGVTGAVLNGQAIIFDAGSTEAILNLEVFGDTVIEDDELIQLQLVNPTAPGIATISIDTASILIENDDAPPTNIEYSITANQTEVDEGGLASFTITRSQAVDDIPYSVNLSSEGTAQFGEDFVVSSISGAGFASGTSLTFAPGVTSATLTLTVVDDDEAEEDEAIEISLGGATAPGTGSIGNGTASTTIIDNDELADIEYSITANQTEVDEGGLASFTITRSQAVDDIPYSVNLSSEGTAQFGEDFVVSSISGAGFASGTSLTFAPGVTSATLTLTVVDDDEAEEDEAIEISLGGATAPGTGSIGNGTASTIIIDNDSRAAIQPIDNLPGFWNLEDTTIYVDINGTTVNAIGDGQPYTGELYSDTDSSTDPNGSDDVMLGTDGDDDIWGGIEGSDAIAAGDGNDTVGFGAGDAIVDAGDGDDFVYAAGNNAGKNTIELGAGNDEFWSPFGNNTVTASSGNNIIGIGAGNNEITTGSGDDFVYLTGDMSGSTNTINLGDGNNETWLTVGNSIITTGSGDDLIGLGNGTDTVNAGDGNNTIYMTEANGTNDGSKDIVTGIGSDWVQTGSGDDYLNLGTNTGGASDFDIAFGGGGSDTFVLNQGSGWLTVGDFIQGVDKLSGIAFEDIESVSTAQNSTWIWKSDNGDVLAELQGFTGTLTAGDFAVL
jgi:hypothetical protein